MAARSLCLGSAKFAHILTILCPVLILFCAALSTQIFAAEPKPADSIPPQVKAFNNLLADPVVADWLKKQVAETPSKPETKPPASEMTMISSDMDSRVSAARDRLRAIAAGAPNLSTDLLQIFRRVREEVRPRAPGVIPLVLALLLLGNGAQWLVRQFSRRVQTNVDERDVHSRLRVVRVRAIFDFIELLAFAAGSIGAFVLFTWPPLIRSVVVGYLVAFLGYKIVITVVQILLRPPTQPHETLTAPRIVPVDDFQARFWFVRAKIILAWAIF